MSETVRLDDETISREQKLRIWQSKSKAPAASFWDSLVELLEHLGPDGESYACLLKMIFEFEDVLVARGNDINHWRASYNGIMDEVLLLGEKTRLLEIKSAQLEDVWEV